MDILTLGDQITMLIRRLAERNTMAEPTYELLYFDDDSGERDKVRFLLAAHYGDRIRFENDHDFIHGYRLAVWIDGESEDGWCGFAEQHGLTNIGLVALSRARYGEGQ